MRIKVKDEEMFQVPGANHFGIGASTNGYTLNYSSDGSTWTAWTAATPANENTIVANCPANFCWKLAGNSGDVWVTY